MIRSTRSLVTNAGNTIPFLQGDKDTIKFVKQHSKSKLVLDMFNINDDYTLDEFCNFKYEISTIGYRKSTLNDGPKINNSKNEIWCFGDSFTFGTGVPADRTWPSIIQTHTDCKVINFGIGGVGPQTVLRLIKEWLLVADYKPKTILTYGFFPGRFEIMNSDNLFEEIISSNYAEAILNMKDMNRKIMSNKSDYIMWNNEIRSIMKDQNLNYHHIEIEDLEFNQWRYAHSISYGRDLLPHRGESRQSAISYYGKRKQHTNQLIYNPNKFIVHPGIYHHKFIGDYFYKL